jgi:polyisoprenoid-binding protein YceI
MKTILTAALILFTSAILSAQPVWELDHSHSNVRFTVTYLIISEVEGNFKKFDGNILSADADFSDALINFAVDINSINTNNEKRDGHLRSDDFFNAARYPEMTFKATSFNKTAGDKFDLQGELTIRDKTHPVKFDVIYGGKTTDRQGNERIGFKASSVINRFDYDLKWNSLTEAGGAVVGKDVAIDLRLQFRKAVN